MFSKKGHGQPHALEVPCDVYRTFTWKATWQVDIGRCPYGSLHASPSIASVPTKPDAWLQLWSLRKGSEISEAPNGCLGDFVVIRLESWGNFSSEQKW